MTFRMVFFKLTLRLIVGFLFEITNMLDTKIIGEQDKTTLDSMSNWQVLNPHPGAHFLVI